jgi:large subunit ribosomal protein L25
MKVSAQKRTPGDSRALRSDGRLPGIVYNKETNIPVSLELREFDKAFRSQGTSSIINLDIDGDEHDVLVRAVQMDKRRRLPIHIDFFAITANQPVDVSLPIEFIGDPIGAKEGGQVDIQRREVRIRILPRLIPGHLEVDVSELAINDSLHVSDIIEKLPTQAEVLDNPEETVIAILPPRVEEPAEPVETEGAEPEVIGEEAEEGAEQTDSESRDE